MGRYIARRTLFMVLVLFLVSLLTFLIFVKMPPGDPALRAAGKTVTKEEIREIRKVLGLNKPIVVQYARFAKGLIPWPGMFLNPKVYFSWKDYIAVRETIFSRLPVTAALVIGAAVLWFTLGTSVGIISAIRRRGLADRAAMIFALLGVSLPVFWIGYVLIYVFSIKLHVLPGGGIPSEENTIQAVLHGRFVLPWIAISLASAAIYARMTRANLIETMSQDYIRTARAKGLSERRVILKHGLRVSLTSLVTLLGLDVGYLMGGAVLTETVFNLNGIGKYLVDSLARNDFPAIMGVTVFASFFIIVANLLVDILYAFLDPRVRYT
jgi:peptide/nickel transport system permease protein